MRARYHARRAYLAQFSEPCPPSPQHPLAFPASRVSRGLKSPRWWHGRSGGAARTVRRHSPEDRRPPTEAVPNMSGTLAALHAITSGEACPAFRKTSPGKVFRGQEPARCASSAAIGLYRRQGGCISARVAATLHHSDDSIWGIPGNRWQGEKGRRSVSG